MMRHLLASATLHAHDSRTPVAEGLDPGFGPFSILAFGPATTELGVGIQWRAFGAGAAVPYATSGSSRSQ